LFDYSENKSLKLFCFKVPPGSHERGAQRAEPQASIQLHQQRAPAAPRWAGNRQSWERGSTSPQDRKQSLLKLMEDAEAYSLG